ncbi:TetR family transcriptional regulator [Nocardia panacis]|uniref:TetR family transcriptional regulator n=1 Tax=Nocardia panacis TaxID=2340916 RepID=UPI00193AD954|nr:TetR family transcriptional regulator [Nocardia panacis]
MPKIIDHDQRRRDIVEVAKRLIIEGGFEAATMRSIVSAGRIRQWRPQALLRQ